MQTGILVETSVRGGSTSACPGWDGADVLCCSLTAMRRGWRGSITADSSTYNTVSCIAYSSTLMWYLRRIFNLHKKKNNIIK
jgi:hypothetical protein